MTLNERSMSKHLEELDKSIEILKEHQKVSQEQSLKNATLQDAVCRRFQIATECCIDLGNHVISGYGLRRPETNSDIFIILFESGYLGEKDFAEKMVEMVKLRNLLAHLCLKANLDLVYSHLKSDMWLFKEFQKIILKLIPADEKDQELWE